MLINKLGLPLGKPAGGLIQKNPQDYIASTLNGTDAKRIAQGHITWPHSLAPCRLARQEAKFKPLA